MMPFSCINILEKELIWTNLNKIRILSFNKVKNMFVKMFEF